MTLWPIYEQHNKKHAASSPKIWHLVLPKAPIHQGEVFANTWTNEWIKTFGEKDNLEDSQPKCFVFSFLFCLNKKQNIIKHIWTALKIHARPR